MRFTVLTPTYNRAHTLGRVYESLSAQTFRDFEWVIVDDRSTDGTKELVASWKPFFPINYIWQSNSGLFSAYNIGVRLAKGEFVLILDSDDRCIPTALERFDYHWRQIPDPSRFANVSCLCCRPDGSIVGDPYPADCVDAFTLADQLRLRPAAEGWGINKTEVLREFPFPEGEKYVPAGLIWNRIRRKYATRFVNEPLRIYYDSGSESITSKPAQLRAESPKYSLIYYRELALSPVPSLIRLRSVIAICYIALVALEWKLVTSFRKLTRSR